MLLHYVDMCELDDNLSTGYCTVLLVSLYQVILHPGLCGIEITNAE